MRNWQLTGTDPLALRLAADTRQFQTDYADDQIWELKIGEGESPALALETRYGGRCGLARLVPMWVVGDSVIYEASAYASQPVVHNFWPSYLRLTARPVAHLALQIEYWAITSHVVGGRFTFHNDGDQPAAVGVDLVAQVMTEREAGDLNLLALENNQLALHLKDIGNLQPVLLMHAVTASGEARPRLAARLTVPPGEQTAIRWVLASRPSVAESLRLAHHWLYNEDWGQHLKQLRAINETTPVIETGDRDRDAAIAFSYKVALSSFVGPTAQLPYPSYVFARIAARGYSPRGDGTDHYWQWSGQTATGTYALLPGIASAAPDLAKGVLYNFLAVAESDGFIDWKPGLGGQRDGALSVPLLASTAWAIYSYTEDRAFLQDVFPGLLRFFHRWFQPDADRDGDGLPEWRDTSQSGFDENPSFVPFRRWAQGADISKAETPDLAAYLIREARSLLAIGDILGQPEAAPSVQERLDGLLAHLKTMWRAETGSFHYRDRDTHVTTTGSLIAEGPADQSLIPSLELDPPNRLVVRVLGGRDHTPTLAVTLEGLDGDGKAVREVLSGEAFVWYRGLGAATSGRVFARIDRITAEGLSRVYTVQVSSVDWTRQDQMLLLPLWAGIDDPARTRVLIETVTDPARYWRPYGISRCPASDAAYDPANRSGCGGVWMPGNLLLGEGLIDAGRPDLAAELLAHIMQAQIGALKTDRGFRGGYNCDAPEGLGDLDFVWGVVPLHLLWRLMGFRIISSRRVLIGGVYALPWPVRVQLHGVTVERSEKGARITFPSGLEKRVRSEKWRAVEDDSVPPGSPASQKPKLPGPPPGPPPPRKPGRKTVKVNVRDDGRESSDPFTR